MLVGSHTVLVLIEECIGGVIQYSFRKINEEGIDIDEECLQLLRENAFVWTMDWAQRISVDIYKCNSHAPFMALSSFSRFVYQKLSFFEIAFQKILV